MIKRAIGILSLLLAGLTLNADSIEDFAIGTRTSPAGTVNPRGYWEYLPTAYELEPTRHFPVVIFLHGLGEGGNGSSDLSKLGNIGPMKLINTASHSLHELFEDEEVIVLSPQLTYNVWWNNNHIRPFLDYAKETYRIDPRRIYLTGLSAGAGGVHSMMNADANADEIAAYVPCAIRGQVLVGEGDQLAPHTAYWALTASGDQRSLAFNSADRLADYLVDPSPNGILSNYPGNSIDRTAYFSESTGWTWEDSVPLNEEASLKVTIFTGSSHNSWDRTYNNANMWAWMLAQEKPTVEISSPLPGAQASLGDTITLSLTATDRDGAAIPEAAIQWSSNIDGDLGTGSTIVTTALQIGVHTLTVYVTDEAHNQSIRLTQTLTIIRSDPYTARFDIGRNDFETADWNNLTDLNSGVIENAFDLNGAATGVRVEVIAPFSGHQTGGVQANDLYPITVQRDTMFITNGEPAGQLKFSGLSTALTYDMTFFASRTASNNRTADYTVGNATVSLNAANNTNQTVQLTDLVPNEDGELILSVACNANASYGYLGAIILTANSAGFDSWLTAHFSESELNDPAISGDDSDPDGDGIPTIIEYALGLDPRTGNSPASLPQIMSQTSQFGFTFTRDPALTDITYEVLASDDLVQWDVIARSTSGNTTSDVAGHTQQIHETGDTSVTVEVIDASTGDRRFYRLQITR